jgi:hypothetical protein
MVLATATGIQSAGYLVEPHGVLERLGEAAWGLSLPLLVAVVLGAFVPPTCRNLIPAVASVGIWFAMLTVSVNVWPHTRDWFFRSRQPEFQALAEATIASGRIHDFWEWPNGTRRLNGALIAVAPGTPLDTIVGRRIVPLDSVLRRDGIDPGQYEETRQRLRSLHVSRLEADEEHVFLGGRDEGFVYVPHSTIPLQEGETPQAKWAGGSAYISRKLTDGWYFIGWR